MTSPLSPFERAFAETAIALASRVNVEQTCAAVLDAAERIFEARSSWLLLHDAQADELVTVVYRGPDADAFAGARLRLRTPTITTTAFHERQPVFVPDVRQEDRWYDAPRVHRSQLRTVFTVPLVYDSVAIGVLGIDGARFSASVPPTPEDVARLQAIAAQAALSIRNARAREDVEQDRARLRRLLEERRHLRATVGTLRQELRETHVKVPIGQSAVFRAVLAQAELVAGADTTVLLIGETGTGKELVARTIHAQSARADQPLVAVNCAAIPETLVESELFGYEKGAFTGALTRQAGKFEMADRGAMLLDEIGDLPLQAQAKLLRVLQEREVHRVGGTKPVAVDVRLIAATNRDLEACIEAGTFRPDLFYRVSVFPIYLPPLRERPEDIPALIEYFLEYSAQRQHRPTPRLASGVMEQLVQYDWPGNVRELQNVVERAVILAREPVVTLSLLALRAPNDPQRSLKPAGPARASTPTSPEMPPADVMQFSEAERRAILGVLEITGWRISGPSGAAALLGLKPTTLHAKMKKLGIRRPSLSATAAERA